MITAARNRNNNKKTPKKNLKNISRKKNHCWGPYSDKVNKLHLRLAEHNYKDIFKAGENDSQRADNIKANINNLEENNKYRLCGDEDETVTHIISESSKWV